MRKTHHPILHLKKCRQGKVYRFHPYVDVELAPRYKGSRVVNCRVSPSSMCENQKIRVMDKIA